MRAWYAGGVSRRFVIEGGGIERASCFAFCAFRFCALVGPCFCGVEGRAGSVPVAAGTRFSASRGTMKAAGMNRSAQGGQLRAFSGAGCAAAAPAAGAAGFLSSSSESPPAIAAACSLSASSDGPAASALASAAGAGAAPPLACEGTRH